MANDLRDYECMVILDRDHPDPDQELQSIGQLIQSQGGEVQQGTIWQKRRLAYPIRDRYEGIYLLILFRAPGQALGELRRYFKLNESVLRSLIQRLN